jgi:hypothetical protein
MGIRPIVAVGLLASTLGLSPFLRAQTESPSGKTKPAADKQLDARDLLVGVWIGNGWHTQVGPGRGPGGLHNYAGVDQRIPEPALTPWAKQHMLYKSISHDALAGTPLPGMDRPGHFCPSEEDVCYSADQNGVPANDPGGEYIGRDCEPVSTPGIYDLPTNGEIEFLPTPDGDRLLEVFEYHREWRTIWLNRHEHPKNLRLTYEGDSIGSWEGNTLVVDTTGYNGKVMISDNIGHARSDVFRLVERFTLVDKDNLEIDMTFYDPKVWGDKSWPGFQKFYHRAPVDRFREFVCSARENLNFDNTVLAPQAAGAKGK